ncbi:MULTISPECIES: hypothetical protein [Marinomonas]|uniref:hypothetical protein n=1 Tax=Marinomonas TaxID=28253 RepID=UPI001055E054|nr:hypothetical protein [Marinomonas flavescens]
MKSNKKANAQTYCDSDTLLICDILSISFDGSVANTHLYQRAMNTTEKHVFLQISAQYKSLSDSLLQGMAPLLKDSGTMNLEAGYIAKAYLTALKSSDKNAPNRVMSVNRQALKRIKKMVNSMKNRLFANWISKHLAWIQITLDYVQHRRAQAVSRSACA